MDQNQRDALKALLTILTAAGVEEFEHQGLKLKFHKTVPLSKPVTAAPPLDPVQQQLAERRPDYAKLFPQGFPPHTPKDTPKSE